MNSDGAVSPTARKDFVMRLAMDRQGSGLSLTQLMSTGVRRERQVRRIDPKTERRARIAFLIGFAACAASLGMLAGQVARAAVGG